MPTSPVSSVVSGCGSSAGEAGPASKAAKKSKKSSQQKGCPPLTPVDASGNRKYKQYTDETLQQALKDVAEGQSINRCINHISDLRSRFMNILIHSK